MTEQERAPSARREELLELSYRYALANGVSGLSLRPLAAAIGSSPRVLLFLFGSKDGLLRALLARARLDELAALPAGTSAAEGSGLSGAIRSTWSWLVDEQHRPLLELWCEVYARSLTDPEGPWGGFAAQTVADWLAVLEAGKPETAGPAERTVVDQTLALSVLRGCLLDLLATGDRARTTAAVERFLELVAPRSDRGAAAARSGSRRSRR